MASQPSPISPASRVITSPPRGRNRDAGRERAGTDAEAAQTDALPSSSSIGYPRERRRDATDDRDRPQMRDGFSECCVVPVLVQALDTGAQTQGEASSESSSRFERFQRRDQWCSNEGQRNGRADADRSRRADGRCRGNKGCSMELARPDVRETARFRSCTGRSELFDGLPPRGVGELHPPSSCMSIAAIASTSTSSSEFKHVNAGA